MFTDKSVSDISVPEYEVWHNDNGWTAQFKNAAKDKIGSPGFGTTKKAAVDDLFYQNIDIIS